MLPVIRALYLMKNSGGTATTFAHLDTTIVLERSIAEMRIYDGGSAQIDLSRPRAPEIVGQEHCTAARGVQKVLQRLKDLQDNIAILCMDEDDACDMILRDSGK